MAQKNQLLPSTAKEFADAKYWQEFFKKRGEAAFEWYIKILFKSFFIVIFIISFKGMGSIVNYVE